MSKAPAIPQEGGETPSRGRGANAATPRAGGEPSNRAREANAAPGTRRGRHAGERRAVQAALHDGAGTSASAVAAHGGNNRHVKLQLPTEEELQYPGRRQDRASRGQGRPEGHGDAGAVTRQPTETAGRRPYYVRPSRTTRPEPSWPAFEQQPPVHYDPNPVGGVQEERLATPPPVPQAGAPPPGVGVPSIPEDATRPKKKKLFEKKTSFLFPRTAARDARPHPHRLPPGEAALPVGEASLPPAGWGGLPHTKTIERVSTLPVGQDAPSGGGGGAAKTIERVSTLPMGEEAPPGGGGAAAMPGTGVPHAKPIERVTTVGETLPMAARDHDKYPPYQPTAREHGKHPSYKHQPEPEPYPRTTVAEPSPWKSNGRTGTDRQLPRFFPADGRKKRRPLAFCFTLCCILFWLLVVGLGVAILVIYLLYHPQPPRLRVTTATLNAGYIDQLPPPRGGLALNSDLYALATIYNPNTKVDVVMRYMELDLYFRGVMIGTTAVWPIHEDPGESVLRNVHLVVSEVRVSREDADAWHNATTRYGLVELKLKARFHVQLNFGRWLPFRYWVYPSCTLWLDPPPGGALRRARCRKSD